MASRNLKPSSVQGFDSANMTDKMQSSTLKRQSSPDWSKADLLRLLSYFEGELQARDIAIATLKAEKAKQLLYQAKYGRFGLGDPFVALQRDAEGKSDTGFDEAAIKSMYDSQLAQLENLIATQRKAQLKMREQLGNCEKRFHKVCTELEEEKQKHAQDTAQGDDVTYMLEKERERLKAEIDFEKSQNKKLEKDLKKTLASLEEERANAARHKQVAIMLIKERKNLIERIVAENQLRDEVETALTEGKSKIQNMAEGLVQESKKSLRMEAAMEEQHTKFDVEREALRMRLQEEEKQTDMLKAEVARLSKQVESLQHQVRSGGTSPNSMQIRSSVSPARGVNLLGRSGSTGGSTLPSSGSSLQSVSSNLSNNPPQAYNTVSSLSTVVTGARPTPGQHPVQGGAGRIYSQPGHKAADISSSPERDVVHKPENSPATVGLTRRSPAQANIRPGPASVMGADHVEVEIGSGPRAVCVSPGISSTSTVHSGSKALPHAGGGTSPVGVSSQARKAQVFGLPSASPLGRGVPPPIPPNKPNYATPGPAGGKPSLPPKVSVVGPGVQAQTPSKDIFPGHYSQTPAKSLSQQSPRMVQIPVTVVGGPSSSSNLPGHGDSVASVRTQVRETSPSAVREASQYVVDSTPLEHSNTVLASAPADSGHALEFLGPEMANLQQLLATMTTDEMHDNKQPLSNSYTPLHSSAKSSSTSEFTSPKSQHLSHVSSGVQIMAQNSSRTEMTANAMSVDSAEKEQNNNKPFLGDHENINLGKVTAQLSSTSTFFKFPNIPLHIFDDHMTDLELTPHQIVSPTSVKSLSVKLNPSPQISSPVSNSSSHFFSPISSQLTTVQADTPITQSPTTKRRSIPTRSRSKSPMKSSHYHPRSYSASFSTGSHTATAALKSSSPKLLSASPISSLRLSPSSEVPESPAHNAATLGNIEALHRILTEHRDDANLTLKDGTTPLHCAAENNQEAIMKVLLENGAKPSSLRDGRVTPLHLAASKGYIGCLRLLLCKGAGVNISTSALQTPLHLSVKAAHIECCQLLLQHGANILFTGQDGLTALHYAVQSNNPEMLKTLLDKLRLSGNSRDSETARQIVAITDKNGLTIAHMAAQLPKQDCLILLKEHLPLDFESKDKLGRSVIVIASVTCKEAISDIGKQLSCVMTVLVELQNIHESTTVSSIEIGVMEVGPGIGWRMIEDRLRGTLSTYLTQLDTGLKTRRIVRLDSDLDRMDNNFTLGLTMSNIKHFEIGFYKWTPGMQTDTSPYLMLSNSEHKKIIITVEDSDNMCELIAFDVLHPASNISSYLRMLVQYKSVIFYGPFGSGKSYLAYRLAQSIAAQELSQGRKPAIYQLSLHSGYTFANFLAYLKQRKCVVPLNHENDDTKNLAPILLLDNLETVDMAQLFGELLDPMEYRGIGHAFSLRGDGNGHSNMHYLVDRFYMMGTMNKSRSLGVDLSILPRFRWVQFRLDMEPMRGLLARHFLRRILNTYHGIMPSPDDPVFRAVEWVVCVWQRLNDTVNKFGIPEVVQGPCVFFKCPLEKQDHKLILQWMKNTWNQHIAPRVRDAIKCGTGSDTASEGQQKVANTALYVLMQHTVILSCPLTGQEKDAYFAGFSGSNELDLPLKAGDSKSRGALLSILSSNSPRIIHQQRRPNSLESASGQTQKQKSEGDSPQVSASAFTFRMKGKNSKEEVHSSNIKRRTLSDSSVNKAAQQEQQQLFLDTFQMPTSSQAKMAKLEVKSPKIVNLASAFRSPSLNSSAAPDSAQSSIPIKKTGRVSPLLTLVANNPHIGQKKSRSSENISSNGTGLTGSCGRLRSPGPFSFSLATPKSNLSSFKFLEKACSSEGGVPLAEQMPDFSVFDKVPTPTDEFPSGGRFMFIQKAEITSDSAGAGTEAEENVWSKRTDVFRPIFRPSGDQDQERENSTCSIESSCL